MTVEVHVCQYGREGYVVDAVHQDVYATIHDRLHQKSPSIHWRSTHLITQTGVSRPFNAFAPDHQRARPSYPQHVQQSLVHNPWLEQPEAALAPLRARDRR